MTPELIVCGLLVLGSFLRGALPERLLSSFLLADLVAEHTYDQVAAPLVWLSIEWGRLSFDIVLFLAIVRVAFRANRFYPLVLGGLQIITLVAYATCAVLPESGAIAHAIMDHWAFNAQLGVMALGLLSHIARERRLRRKYHNWIDAPPERETPP